MVRGDDNEVRHAWWTQAVVPPVLLLTAWWATRSEGTSSFLSRLFLGMWIHELGHAVTAWFCGYGAVPGPWRTMVGEERSLLVGLLLAGFLLWALTAAWRSGNAPLTLAVGLLLALQFVGTVRLSTRSAHAAFTFGGDAGNLVLGPLLMLTFHLPREHPVRQRGLHWGFVFIGAFAFADVANQWSRAARDFAEIPFGEIEDVGLSDASRLVQDFGWTERQLVGRYNALATVALLVLASVHVLAVLRARRQGTGS
jgi:hypothetical protein